MRRRRNKEQAFEPEQIIEKVETYNSDTTKVSEEIGNKFPEYKKPEIKDKSIVRLTKDLLTAGQMLKQQIEESRIEREEFKKLLNKDFEPKNIGSDTLTEEQKKDIEENIKHLKI